MEIFSSPRVTPVTPQHGARNMGSFDKVHGRDARAPQDLQELWQNVRHDDPYCAAMTPPREKLTALQNMTPHAKRVGPAKHLRE
eukprot:6092751-Pyramimonas_sp.AAC.1